MSPLRVLLRALLCISLVLNGSGVAVAAIKMQTAHATVAMTTTPPSDSSSGVARAEACHEAPAMAMPAVHDHGVTADDGTDTSTCTHESPDCCKASTCECNCLQLVQASIATSGIGEPMVVHSTGVPPMKTGHPSPALPHLIRPPIG